MIYLDNAATTWPKPPCVRHAMMQAMERFGANPGRGGHRMSLQTAEEVYRCRESAAALFNAPDPSRVIFTANCTMALNIAVKGVLGENGHAIISDLEHNAVMRPLTACGAPYTVARVEENDDCTVDNFRRAITPATRAIICMHASNVFGTVLPIARLGALARAHGLLFIVDAAQTAGVLPLDMQAMQIDLLCAAGHKGLYGPSGTGLLIVGDRFTPPPLLEGGTGSESLSPLQPEALPERLESGTINTVGICGLRAGIDWVRRHGAKAIGQEETTRLARLYDCLADTRGIVLYTPRPIYGQTAPLLSFNVAGQDSETVAAMLDTHGVAVRAGLHCAPAAHCRFGTLPNGTVRLAPSLFTTTAQSEQVCKILMNFARNTLQY